MQSLKKCTVIFLVAFYHVAIHIRYQVCDKVQWLDPLTSSKVHEIIIKPLDKEVRLWNVVGLDAQSTLWPGTKIPWKWFSLFMFVVTCEHSHISLNDQFDNRYAYFSVLSMNCKFAYFCSFWVLRILWVINFECS